MSGDPVLGGRSGNGNAAVRRLGYVVAAGYVLLIGGSLWMRSLLIEVSRRLDRIESVAAGNVDERVRPEPIPGAPQLVTIRTVAMGCPVARALAPVFEELRDKFSAKDVMFVTLDVTDEEAKRQSDQYCCGLGIDWFMRQGYDSGVIALVDRARREVLSVCVDADQEPRIEGAIRLALAKPNLAP